MGAARLGVARADVDGVAWPGLTGDGLVSLVLRLTGDGLVSLVLMAPGREHTEWCRSDGAGLVWPGVPASAGCPRRGIAGRVPGLTGGGA
jgi:hypothetical protein